MAGLFENTRIHTMTVPNRFVRSATFEGMADEAGRVTPRLADYVADLARGEVGLIISGHTFVSAEGRAGPLQMAAYDEAHREGLAMLARAVHDAGGLIALQIAHAGNVAASALSGLEPVGPSVLEEDGKPVCRAATAADLHNLKESFARAALMAKQAGFDGVQVHAAHGYLLSQFLCPALNKRTDEYGGSLENRVRFPVEVVRAVRQAVGPDYPVLVKMNAEDFFEGGLTGQDALAAAMAYQQAGVDAVELSGGSRLAGAKRMPARLGAIKSREQEAYYRVQAAAMKKALSIPLILVGGVRSFEVAQELVQGGTADFVSMCRPLICEPGLVKRWHGGDLAPSACVSDNACYGPAFDGRGVFCVTLAKRQEKGKA